MTSKPIATFQTCYQLNLFCTTLDRMHENGPGLTVDSDTGIVKVIVSIRLNIWHIFVIGKKYFTVA